MRVLIAAACALSAAMAGAQDDPGGPRRGGRPREEIFRLIDEHIARSLQERVGLADDEAPRVLPLVQRLHAERRRLAARRIRAMQQMRRAFRPGAPVVGDARAAEMLQELKAAEADETAGVRAGQAAIDAVLTPLQQVRYRLFEAEMEHRLRELMSRVRAQRRGEIAGRRRGLRPRGESPAPQ